MKISAEGKSLLESTPVGTLFPQHMDRLVTVSTRDCIADAFKKLLDHKVWSVPVFDPSKRKYVSFLDMVDLVTWIVSNLSETKLKNQDLNSVLENHFSDVTCSDVADISKRNPFCPIDTHAPLLLAIELMAKWQVHRIPIFDSAGELITILSQSQIVNYLYSQMYQMGSLKQAKIADLGMQKVGVLTAETSARAIDAFQAMHYYKVSALAVVDASGSLIGNISVSDLRAVGFDGKLLQKLYKPLGEFLKDEKLEIREAVSVTPDCCFDEVVDKLVTNQIHRVYVVDATNKPIGVVSHLEVLNGVLASVRA